MEPIRNAAHDVLRAAHAEALDIHRETPKATDLRDVAPMAAHCALDIAHETARQVAPMLLHPTARQHVEQAMRHLRAATETDADARDWPNDLDLIENP